MSVVRGCHVHALFGRSIRWISERAYFAVLHAYVTSYGYSRQLDLTPYLDELPRFRFATWKWTAPARLFTGRETAPGSQSV